MEVTVLCALLIFYDTVNQFHQYLSLMIKKGLFVISEQNFFKIYL